jgi:hypothetical protein
MEQAGATAAQPKKDARHSKRVETDLPLKLTREGLAGPMIVNGRCINVGESGLGAVLPSALVIGETVKLTFALPDVSESFDLKARVLYRHGDRYGFYFLDLTDCNRVDLVRGCQLLAG